MFRKLWRSTLVGTYIIAIVSLRGKIRKKLIYKLIDKPMSRFLRSQRTSCPECRTKWTNRALKKLFLNIIPPDNQVNEDRLMTQLVEHKSIAEKMMRERDVIDFEKTQLMVQLAKSHDEYKKVM